jgi:hypothetical protein
LKANVETIFVTLQVQGLKPGAFKLRVFWKPGAFELKALHLIGSRVESRRFYAMGLGLGFRV